MEVIGIVRVQVPGLPHYGIVQILKVVVHRSPARDPAGQGNPVAAHIFQVNLRIGALVQAYDYGGSVPPQEEHRFVEGEAFEREIVEGHIAAGLGAVVGQILHCQLQNSSMAGTIYFFISGKTG